MPIAKRPPIRAEHYQSGPERTHRERVLCGLDTQEADTMSAYRDRRRVLEPAGAVYDSPTERAALDHARTWRPDARLARGSAHTHTRPAHQLCGGGCSRPGTPGHETCQRGCGTHSARHCGGRYFAARTGINFVKGDASLRVALGQKRQARIKERGW